MKYTSELYATLFDVLRNYKEYNMYKTKAPIAVKAISVKHPEVSSSEIHELFNKSIKLYEQAYELIKLYPAFHSDSPMHLPKEKRDAFIHSNNEFPEEFINWILGWIYHWYYER